MALIDKASLLMVPSTYEAGTLYNVLPSGNRAPDSTDQNSGYDQTRADFTFDRGSNAAATRVNASGLIEKYRENLLLNSNQFDTTWVNANSSETSGQADKDGGTDAWKIDISGAGGRIYQSVSQSGVSTYSIYAKAGSLNWIILSSNIVDASFDLSNGVKGTLVGGISSSIESVGGGWYRCSASLNGSLTQVRVYPSNADNDFTSTSGSIYIQSAQLEKGLVATDYLESTSVTGKAGVLVDLPRINYDANGENGSLLLEPSRANLIPQSEWFGSGSGWSLLNNVSIGNFVLSPEGKMNATQIIFDGTTGGRIERTISGLTAGADYSVSVYARVASGTQDVFFGSFEDTPAITLTTEWQRFEKTQPENDTNAYPRIRCEEAATIEIYGFQLELGSYATSYIPTMGTSETRAADIVDGKEDSALYNDSEGVLFVEFSALSATRDNEFRFMISNGTNDERIQIGLQTGGDLYASVIEGNSATASFNYTLPNPTQTHKVAIKYKANDCALWVDGIERGTDISATMPSGLDVFDFYRTPNNNNYVEANVKQVIYFNEALSDSELATLTTL